MKKLIFLAFSLFMLSSAFTPARLFCAENKAPDKNPYVIGCGDILEITTWKEEDFTLKEAFVRIDGKITFPLLDDVQAAGRTPMELKNILQAKLKDYIDSPIVTVNVSHPNSQRFYILGEIARTGEYPLTKQLTLLQAFALAGGFTEWAAKKEIILMRKENGKTKQYRVNYKDIAKGKNLDQNVLIRADDTIIVP